MSIGARPIGTRAIGDSTLGAAVAAAIVTTGTFHYVPFVAGVTAVGGGTFTAPVTTVTFPGSAVLNGVATLVAVGRVGLRGSAVLPASGTFIGNGAQTRNGAAVLAGRAGFVASVTVPLVANLGTQKLPYKVIIVSSAGAPLAEFENAKLESVSWELNGPGGCSFIVPTLDPKTVWALAVAEREVQIWRGNQLLWWGVIVRARADDDNTQVEAVGLLWYFTKRFIGKVDRTNFIPNPSFEPPQYAAGWTIGWWHSVTTPAADRDPALFEWSISTEHVVTGNRSLYMRTLNPDRPLYGIVAQYDFTFLAPADSPAGTVWTVAAWCYIPANLWTGPNALNLGLTMDRASTTEFVTVTPPAPLPPETYPVIIESVTVPLTNETKRDTLTRVEASLTQPVTGVAETIVIRLHAPDGAIFWDEVTLTRNEKLAYYSVDQALIVKGLVEHLQSPTFAKNSLNIGTNCPLTGIVRDREWLHSEHQIGYDALVEFPTLHEGVDIDIAITPTTRTFTTHYPRKGSVRAVTLELGRNLSSFEIGYDGESMANSIVVLGDGEGSDREEGGAQDAASLASGLILEKVYNATPGSTIRTLDHQAERGLQRFKKPVIVPTVTTYEGAAGGLIGVLNTGDVVPVRIKRGSVNVADDYRIIKIDLNPDTDELSYALNPAATEF